jgi:hypothetical protein
MSKPKSERAESVGGGQQSFKKGGGFIDDSKVKALCKKYDIPYERGLQLMQQYSKGGTKIDTYSKGGKKKNTTGMPKYQGDQGSGVVNNNSPIFSNNKRAYSEQEKARVLDYYRRFLDPKLLEVVRNNLDRGTIQLNEAVVFGDEVSSYLRPIGKQPQTGAVDTYGDQTNQTIKQFLLNGFFKNEFGRDFDASNPKDVFEAQKLYQDSFKSRFGQDFDVDPTTGSIRDSRFGNRTASFFQIDDSLEAKQSGRIDLTELEKLDDEEANKLLEPFGITKEQALSKKTATTRFLNLVSQPNTQESKADPKKGKEVDLDTGKILNKNNVDRRGMAFLAFPDQNPMFPSSRQYHNQFENSLGRIDPSEVTAQSAINRINEQADMAYDAAYRQGDASSVLAQSAISNNAMSQAVQAETQANAMNADLENKAEQFNIAQADQEGMLNNREAKESQKLNMIAGAKTEEDIRNYFDTLTDIQVSNYNTVNKMNQINQLYDNFYIDANGNPVATNNGRDVLRKGLGTIINQSNS